MRIRVLIADDHTILREGVRTLLEALNDMRVVGEAPDGRTAIRLAAELTPDVVVMDVAMPDLNGVEATRSIVAGSPGTRVLALSMHADRHFMADMLRAGAAGYLLKTSCSAELAAAVRTLAAGKAYLSPDVTGAVVEDYVHHLPGRAGTPFTTLTAREREVLQLVAEGRTTKEIAAALHVAGRTIEAHRSQIMDKLRVHSVAGLTKLAVKEGITSPEP